MRIARKTARLWPLLATCLLASGLPTTATPGGMSLDRLPTFVAFTPVSVEVDPRDQTLWVADQYLPRIAHLGTDGALLSVFPASQYGGGPPAGITFEGSSGDFLYVSDPSLVRLVRLDRQGKLAGEIAVGCLGLGNPADLAWNAEDASLYVADPASRQVFNLRPRDSNADGLPDTADLLDLFSTLPLGSDNPMGLARDRTSGHLFLSDPALDRIFEVTRAGDLVTSFDSGFYGGTSVTGLAWESVPERLRLADAGRKILTMSESGAPLGVLRTAPFGSLSPQGLTWDPATQTLMVVTGERKLIRFQPDDPDQTGSPVGTLQWRQEWTTPFSSLAPSGIAQDPVSGDRFVSDSLQHRIFRVDSSGGTVASFDTAAFGSSRPTGLALCPSGGSLFVSDSQARKIFEITPSGTPIGSFSTSPFKQKPPSEPLCNNPLGVAYDATSDHLFIADFQAARVFEVTRSGTFVAAFSTAPAAPYPTDLAVDSAGDRIVVADSSGHLAEYSRGGLPGIRYPGVPLRVRISGASSVSVDPDTRQRVLTDPEQDAVFFLSPSGPALGQISLEPYGIRSPAAAAWWGAASSLYVVDHGSSRVYAITAGPDGSFGTADDSSAYYSTPSAGSTAPVGLTLDRDRAKLGWVDELTLRLYWMTMGFNYLGSVDLAPAGATALRGIDQDPTSGYLFACDASAGIVVTSASGSIIQTLPPSELGIGNLGGGGLSPAEGLFLAVDRADATLVALDMRPLLLPEVLQLDLSAAGGIGWSTDAVFAGYQIYRGVLTQLALGQYGGCFWVGSAPPALDGEVPAEGQGWFYLVAGSNPTGLGSLGRMSDGPERPKSSLTPACP